MVARHCGYRPLEINASDDRTATTLVSRINDAVQMQAVIGSARPNCVIIDEIDGAAGAHTVSYTTHLNENSNRVVIIGLQVHGNISLIIHPIRRIAPVW